MYTWNNFITNKFLDYNKKHKQSRYLLVWTVHKSNFFNVDDEQQKLRAAWSNFTTLQAILMLQKEPHTPSIIMSNWILMKTMPQSRPQPLCKHQKFVTFYDLLFSSHKYAVQPGDPEVLVSSCCLINIPLIRLL